MERMKCMTVNEARGYLGYKLRYVMRLIEHGRLQRAPWDQAGPCGPQTLITKESIERFLEARGAKQRG